MSIRERDLALGLIAEVEKEALAKIPYKWLSTASQLPAVAAHLATGSRHNPSKLLGQVHNRQLIWRQEFADWLAVRKASGICVVGNAASLHGASIGAQIENAGAVVRFNRFRNAKLSETDVGKRTDAWVMSPGFRGDLPQEIEWTIVTGPDMRFRQRNWSSIIPLLETGYPVLTIPLPIWRSLVQALKAPPSAGVLMLAWVRELLGSWEAVTSAGIGVGFSVGRYHAANPRQRAASRHDWCAEQMLVAQWQKMGLRMLPGLA